MNWSPVSAMAVALTMLGAAIVIGIWRWRVASLLQRNRELEERVAERTAELHLATEELHFLAFHDDLTALINHRGFWQHAERLELESRTGDKIFGLVLVDLDHFKSINDEHGHRTGDDVLRHAGGLMQRHFREEDFVCRCGGEEFAILVVDTGPDHLRQLAESLRVFVAESVFEDSQRKVPITASVGVSYWLGGNDNVEAMFERADKAMYEAKETRNTWLMWNPAMDYEADQEHA